MRAKGAPVLWVPLRRRVAWSRWDMLPGSRSPCLESSHKVIHPESVYGRYRTTSGTSHRKAGGRDAAKNVIEQAGEHLREAAHSGRS